MSAGYWSVYPMGKLRRSKASTIFSMSCAALCLSGGVPDRFASLQGLKRWCLTRSSIRFPAESLERPFLEIQLKVIEKSPGDFHARREHSVEKSKVHSVIQRSLA